MSIFTPEGFKSRLAELDGTQPVIERTSRWLQLHEDSIEQIVDVWYEELLKGAISTSVLELILPVYSSTFQTVVLPVLAE